MAGPTPSGRVENEVPSPARPPNLPTEEGQADDPAARAAGTVATLAPQGARPPIPPPDVLALQRTAGNRAVTSNLAPAGGRLVTIQRDGAPPAAPAPVSPPATGTAKTTRASVEDVAETIYVNLHIGGLTPQKIEQILSETLTHHDQAADIRKSYKDKYKLDLDAELNDWLGAVDALKAIEYLDQGRLRPIAKTLIALAGSGTDTTTLYRVLEDVHKEGEPETQWGGLVGNPSVKLADGGVSPVRASSRGESLAQALDDDLDGYELVKAMVLVNEGKLRPVDEIFIAMDQAGTDEALLFRGLASSNKATIRDDYRSYYYKRYSTWANSGDLLEDLDSELDGEDLNRALALIGWELNPKHGIIWGRGEPKFQEIKAGQRLVALVKAAVGGLGTNTELIWSSIQEAPQVERDELKKLVEQEGDPLGLAGWFGDLNDADMGRMRALLGIKEEADAQGLSGVPGANEDASVRMLRSLGGIDITSVFDAIKMSGTPLTRPHHLAFKAGWQDRSSVFNRYVSKNTVAAEKADLDVVFGTDAKQKLNWAIDRINTDEDYFFHVLENFTNDAGKRALIADTAFMDKLSGITGALSSAEYDRTLTLLRPTDMTPEERAKWLNEAVGRERSIFFDLFSSTGDAVRDENRELQAGAVTAGLDSSLSPAERALLEEQAGRTERSLNEYAAARDEFVNTASTIVNIAVGVIAAIATAGAAGPIVAAQIARAAAVMAMTRVLTEKVIRGDRFDVFGSDGAVAFVTGATDGAMNVLGGAAARGIITKGMEGIAEAAGETARNSFRSVGVRGLRQVVEGGISGGASGMVGTMAQDETWRQGFLAGLEKTAWGTATGAGQGAAVAGVLFAGGETIGALKGKGKGEGGEGGGKEGGGGGTGAAAAEALSDTHPLVTAVRNGDAAATRQLIDQMQVWENGIRDIQSGKGRWEGVSKPVRDDVIAKLKDSRQQVVDFLGKQFDAHPAAGASTEAISDVDLSVKGDDAGAKLMAAEATLDAMMPGWRTKLRMALMIDAERIGTYATALEGVPPEVQAAIQARVTREAEALTFARRLRNADAAEKAALLKDPPEGVDVRRAQQIADMGADARKAMRDAALDQADKKMTRMRQATDPLEKARLAEEITYQQMLANAMGDDAYISPGGVRGFVQGQALRNVHEQYHALIDQVEMMAHQVHQAGGVLEAMRSYELFKYINRFCQVLKAADIHDPALDWFLHWSELVYRVDRAGTGAEARPLGVGPEGLASSASKASVRYTDLDVPTKGPSNEFLLDNYRRFQALADHYAGDFRNKALGEGAQPAPAGGGPAGPQAAPQVPATVHPPDPTAQDGVTPAGGAGAPGTAVRRTTPLLVGENKVIGRSIPNELQARSIHRRLGNGDATALAEIGVTAPPDYTPQGREWGIGQRVDGSYVIIEGAMDGVTWAALEAQGIVAVGHSHPMYFGREMRTPGRTVADLAANPDLDTTLVFPSGEDVMFLSRRNMAMHDVAVPYLHTGQGRLANPGAMGDPVTFRLRNASVSGHVGTVEVGHVDVEVIAGGRVIWRGELWSMNLKGGLLFTTQPPNYVPNPP